MIGEANAQYAHGGISLASGSVLDSVTTTRGTAALDAELIKTNALREALGLETQATSFEMQASNARQRGRDAAWGTLLGGAGSMLGMGYASGALPKLGKG